MIEVTHKPQVSKVDIMFGDNGLMIGTFWLLQGKSRLEKKLFLKQGYKHLLFRAEAIDKNVVKQDIVELRVNTGSLRLILLTPTGLITKSDQSESVSLKVIFLLASNFSNSPKKYLKPNIDH